MNFLKIPNLREKPVKAAVIDARASDRLVQMLTGLDVELVKTKRHPGVYDAIAFHPDIVVHHVRDNIMVYAPGTEEGFIYSLERLGFSMTAGITELGRSYPHNIA